MTLLGTVPLHPSKQFVQPQPAAIPCGYEVPHRDLFSVRHGPFGSADLDQMLPSEAFGTAASTQQGWRLPPRPLQVGDGVFELGVGGPQILAERSAFAVSAPVNPALWISSLHGSDLPICFFCY